MEANNLPSDEQYQAMLDRLAVVPDGVPVPEALELLAVRCVSRFLQEVLVLEVDVDVGCLGIATVV